jgi:catalase
MPKIKRERNDNATKKIKELAPDISEMDGTTLTSNQGVAINDTNNTLKAGERGPSLLEDFLMREKITHFDHERIPERAVHARGVAARGYFQAYKAVPQLTKGSNEIFRGKPGTQPGLAVRLRSKLPRAAQYSANASSG